ncbi:MAG TPA: hypothetical protein V6D11_25890 [Waterburya sp.]
MPNSQFPIPMPRTQSGAGKSNVEQLSRLRSRHQSDKLKTHANPVETTFHAPRNWLNQRHIRRWH